MGRSEAISSHLKPSIISATIYRADDTGRPCPLLSCHGLMIRRRPNQFSSAFLSRDFARARACGHDSSQRLEDCAEVFVSEIYNVLFQYSPTYCPLRGIIVINRRGRRTDEFNAVTIIRQLRAGWNINFERKRPGKKIYPVHSGARIRSDR